MSLHNRLDDRLRGEENSQLLALLLLLLTLVMLFSWSANPTASNDSWYGVSAVRLAGLGLLAVMSAIQCSSRSSAEQLAGFMATVVASAITVPFELVSFAASYPAASLPAALVFSFSFPLGLFGLALLTARLLGRLRWLALPLVLLLLAGIFVLDGLTGMQLLSPVTILQDDSWLLVGIWTLLALGTAGWLIALRSQNE